MLGLLKKKECTTVNINDLDDFMGGYGSYV